MKTTAIFFVTAILSAVSSFGAPIQLRSRDVASEEPASIGRRVPQAIAADAPGLKARTPTPRSEGSRDEAVIRRFPRRVYYEHYAARSPSEEEVNPQARHYEQEDVKRSASSEAADALEARNKRRAARNNASRGERFARTLQAPGVKVRSPGSASPAALRNRAPAPVAGQVVAEKREPVKEEKREPVNAEKREPAVVEKREPATAPVVVEKRESVKAEKRVEQPAVVEKREASPEAPAPVKRLTKAEMDARDAYHWQKDREASPVAPAPVKRLTKAEMDARDEYHWHKHKEIHLHPIIHVGSSCGCKDSCQQSAATTTLGVGSVAGSGTCPCSGGAATVTVTVTATATGADTATATGAGSAIVTGTATVSASGSGSTATATDSGSLSASGSATVTGADGSASASASATVTNSSRKTRPWNAAKRDGGIKFKREDAFTGDLKRSTDNPPLKRVTSPIQKRDAEPEPPLKRDTPSSPPLDQRNASPPQAREPVAQEAPAPVARDTPAAPVVRDTTTPPVARDASAPLARDVPTLQRDGIAPSPRRRGSSANIRRVTPAPSHRRSKFRRTSS